MKKQNKMLLKIIIDILFIITTIVLLSIYIVDNNKVGITIAIFNIIIWIVVLILHLLHYDIFKRYNK